MKSVIASIAPKNIVSTIVILITYNTLYDNKRGINLSFLTTKNFKNSKAIWSFLQPPGLKSKNLIWLTRGINTYMNVKEMSNAVQKILISNLI